jgi:hypothetical protein
MSSALVRLSRVAVYCPPGKNEQLVYIFHALIVLVPAPQSPVGRTLFRSEFSIHLSACLPEFYRFFLHTALQRLDFENADLRGVIG